MELESKFEQFYDKHFPQYKGLMEFRLQKMTDIHLKNNREFDRSIIADPNKLNVLLVVAILVLVLANFNFVNLSTAQASYRNKEIGVRKIIGANKIEIVWQLLSESFLLSFLSLSIVLFILFYFSSDIKSYANINYIFTPQKHIPVFIGITLITSILSGIYPAILMSKFNPLKFLQTSNPVSSTRFPLRNVLIVFQFATTIALLISLSVIFHQMRFIKNKDLGFDKDQILTVPIWNDSTYQTTKRLKNILSDFNEFSNISIASFAPGEDPFFEHFKPQGYDSHIPLRYINVDPEYIPTLDIQIIEGRNFSVHNEADKKSLIINESALRTFGWDQEQAIGKTIEYNFSQSWDDLIEGKVIGVIQDFNYGPLRNKIDPIILTMHLDFYPNLIMKIDGNNIEKAVKHLETHYKQLNNEYPVEYTFLDEQINFQYKSEQYFSKIMVFFTFLAILISALGLFGLSSFMMEKRIKEISIRKVHGASFIQLYFIFSGNFIKWIFISLLFALPFAWYFSKEWLAGFAYRIQLNSYHILFAVFTVALIVFCTVSYHAFTIALKNPSKILKSE
jgi:putative ABC transport system permease protein